MKCDTCKFKIFYQGSGAPDDYSTEYCSKGNWEGGCDNERDNEGDNEENDTWDDCKDFIES